MCTPLLSLAMGAFFSFIVIFNCYPFEYNEDCTLNNTPEVTDQSDPQVQLANFYLFLSQIMCFPEEHLLTDEFLDVYENWLNELDMHEEYELFRVLRKEENLLETLQIEYTRLFINAVPHLIAAPYASVYQKSDQDLQGKITEKTRDFYRAQGFDIVNTAEPADHIRFELEFLSALAGNGKTEEEEQFLQTLFRPWFSEFKERVVQGAEHPYYTIAVKLIDLFTRKDG
jgi:TorA maturation chaperone TorD